MSENGLKLKLEKMKLALAIKKAETNRDELEYKILERQEEIERIREHIKLQEALIVEHTESLKNLG